MTEALSLTAKLAALSILIQTIEFFRIRASFGENGVWDWNILRDEFQGFPKLFQWALNRILDYPDFIALLTLRLLSAGILLLAPWDEVSWIFPLILFLSSVLISLRWRGSYNGGSDYMTVTVTLSLCLSKLFESHPLVAKACLWYVAVQCCLSYFLAGLVKLKNPEWRSGKIIEFIRELPSYNVPENLKKTLKNPWVAFLACWGILTFECLFPLALVDPRICLVLIPLGLAFHLVNSYAFGLNRFLLAWAAAYPALYYCSTSMLNR